MRIAAHAESLSRPPAHSLTRALLSFALLLACSTLSSRCLAQTIVDDGEDQDLLPQTSRPAPPTARPTPPEESESVSWETPPIPWRGQLGLTAFTSKNNAQSYGGLVKTLSANAESYIWQPWFIGLSGGGNFSQSDNTGNAGATSGDSFSGTLSARALPASRFPATISLSGGQASTTDSFKQTQTAKYENLTWNQGYSPASGSFKSNMTYWRNSVTQDQEQTLSNRLGGNIVFRLKTESPQSLLLKTEIQDTKISGERDATSKQQDLQGYHSIYLEDYVMSITSNASSSQQEQRDSASITDWTQNLIASNMDWLPSDDYPLRITSGVRLFQLNSTVSSAAATSAGQAGLKLDTNEFNLTARYPLDKNWNFSVFTSALSTRYGTQSNSSQYSLGSTAAWQGDGITRPLGEWTYRLSYGSGLTATYSDLKMSEFTEQKTESSWSASASNAFSRNVPLNGYKNPMIVSVSQNLTATENTGKTSNPSSQTLTHTATASWAPRATEETQTSLNTNLSDGRTFGEVPSSFQSVGAGINERRNLARYQTLSGTISINFSKQGNTGQNNAWKGRATFNSIYSHARFANINRLYYSLNYSLLASPKETTGASSDANGWRAEHRLNQTLSWRYGLLSWKLDNMNSVSPDGLSSHSIWLKVTRDFSGVL